MNEYQSVFNVEFLIWVTIAIVIWIVSPIWIYIVVRAISTAWFKGKIETQKEQLEEVNGKK